MTAAERKKFAEQLRAAINASGMSQAEVARASGVDKTVLSRFMAGERGLSFESIERLASALGLSLVALKKKR